MIIGIMWTAPHVGDIDVGTATTPDWRTYLVGTMGAGGRGYFVLDITKPGSDEPTSTVTNAFGVETNALTW